MSDAPAPVLAAELIRWSWVGDHLDDIRGYLFQHVQLTVLAVLFGLLLAFPLALVAIRWPRTYGAGPGLHRGPVHHPLAGPVRPADPVHRAVGPDLADRADHATRC